MPGANVRKNLHTKADWDVLPQTGGLPDPLLPLFYDDRGLDDFATEYAPKTYYFHQAFNSTPGDAKALAEQLTPDFSCPIDTVIFSVNAFYLLDDLSIALFSLATFLRM